MRLLRPRLLLLLFGLIVYLSCKKIDFTDKPSPQDIESIEKKFFGEHTSSDPTIQSLTAFIKTRNDKRHFVEKVVEQIGYPRWDKAMTRQNRNVAGRGNGSTDTADITYIPFVRDSQHYVNAALVIKTTDTDTAFRYICDWQYKDYGFDTTGTGWNARTVFNLFTLLDHQTFEHTRFRVLDSLLFGSGNITATLLSTNSANQRLSPTVTCTVYEILTCESWGYARSSATSTDHCYFTYPTFCTTIWTWAPDDGNGGGGGGGGGGDTPPPCSGSTAQRRPDDDPCGPGWEPIEDDGGGGGGNGQQDPCMIAQNAARKMDSLYAAVNADSVLATIPNLATQANENGFPFIRKFSVSPYNTQDTTISYHTDGVHMGTDSGIYYQTTLNWNERLVASLHTHPPTGYAAPSAKDVYILIENRAQNDYRYVGNYMVASNGSQYALTITDAVKAANFYNTMGQFLTGTKWNMDSEIGKAFKAASEYFEKKFKGDPNQTNLAYEMAMAAVLKQYDVGITLNKKDAAGNFKPLIVKTANDPKKPKRTIYVQECN